MLLEWGVGVEVRGDAVASVVVVYGRLVELVGEHQLVLTCQPEVSQLFKKGLQELRNGALILLVLVDPIPAVLKLVAIMLHSPVVKLGPFARIQEFEQLGLLLLSNEVFEQVYTWNEPSLVVQGGIGQV